MKNVVMTCGAWLLLLMPLTAQVGGDTGKSGAQASEAKVRAKSTRPPLSDGAKAAIANARQLASQARGLQKAERSHALELAATAYDKVVGEFAGEPAAAAVAAFAGAELWRQQGSLALAEKDYLQAAQFDAERFQQRGLMGAADMQRRQQRAEEALATYVKAAAIEPGSSRAQSCRLWQARLLQTLERIDEAIPAFQASLESAAPGAQTIEAANFLALAWVEKGDFDAAARAIDHAEHALVALDEEDPIVLERLRKSIDSMSARKALQRARDKEAKAGQAAAELDGDRRRTNQQ